MSENNPEMSKEEIEAMIQEKQEGLESSEAPKVEAAEKENLLQTVEDLKAYVDAQRLQIQELKQGKKVIADQGPKVSHFDKGRVYDGQEEVDHDLFVLQTRGTKKEIGYNARPEHKNYMLVDHMHRFHTHDSNGRLQQFACSGLGHTHEVIVEYNEDGSIKTAKCSPPLRKHKGKMIPYPMDNHTHEITYVRSEKIAKRTVSQEAAKTMSAYFQQENEAARGARGL